MTKDIKTKLSYIEGYISIFVNILLFGLKLWAGTISKSVSITADAWHTLSDSISSIVVIWGAKVSKKPADNDHPFGHGRAELIGAFIIGFLLLFVCYEFVIRSIVSITTRSESVFTKCAVIVTIISIIVKEIMARLAIYWGKITNSKSLRADGLHHRSDVLSSLVILVGIFISKYYWWADGVLGLIVSGFILYSAYEIIKDTISSILGESPSKKIIAEMIALGNETAGMDIRMHHIHLHTYGDHIELTLHIYLPANYNLKESHDLCNKLEDAIKDKYGYTSTIHVDPDDIIENN